MMGWQTLDLVLLRGLVPACLLGCSIARFNGFSCSYLIMLLICPFLKFHVSGRSRLVVLAYLSLLIIGSGSFTLLISICNIALLFSPGLLDKGLSNYTSLLHQIGITRLQGMPYYRVIRLVLPDPLILAMAIGLFVYFFKRSCTHTEIIKEPSIERSPISHERMVIKSNETMFSQTVPSRPSSFIHQDSYLLNTFGIDHTEQEAWQTWVRQGMFVFLNIILTGFAGIISPSTLNCIYLLVFLGTCTTWACGNKIITAKFSLLRIILLIYSGVHVCLLYLIQLEGAQLIIPNNGFLSRLLGLYYIIDSSCDRRGELIIKDHRWIDYLSPWIVFSVYYFCANQTRRWFEELSHSRSMKLFVSDDNIEEVTSKETEKLLSSPTRKEEGNGEIQRENEIVKENLPNVKLFQKERPLLLSLIQTAIRNSFVFTFIAMMSWSATYKSWMSFVLLLIACYLWMTPHSRNACLYMSPLIVSYATALVLIQYVYGLNLPELPTTFVTAEGTRMNLSDIGLHKYDIPITPLSVKIGFLAIFWLTLRLFMTDQYLKIRADNLVAKTNLQLRRNSETSTEIIFGNVDSAKYQKFVCFVNEACAKYWICICCCAMMVVSIRGQVVGFKIVYMLMLVYLLFTFMCSYSFWRKQMKLFWWAVIVYSVIVLLAIYTFQFDPIPIIWKNKTGISKEVFMDVGFQRYAASTLFQGLLIPVIFLVVIIVQLRYFHEKFLTLSSLSRFRSSHEVEENEHVSSTNLLDSSNSDSSQSNVSEFITDIHSAFQTVVVKTRQLIVTTKKNIWRFLECHFVKIVVLLIMYACIREVNASNIVLVVTIVVCIPFPKLHEFLVTSCFFYCSLIVLMKMIYQLKTIQDFNWLTNCSVFSNNSVISMNRIVNAKWIGLEKVESFVDIITKWTVVLAACALWHVIKYHQNQFYNSPTATRAPMGIIFPEVDIHNLNDNFLDLFKTCLNFTFYKFGLELGFVVTIIVACLRVDVYSLIYLLLAFLFLCFDRETCARFWMPYLIFLGTLLPIQYAICIGIPPGLCQKYPFSFIEKKLRMYLFLPNYEDPPAAEKLMADFVQYLFVALQYQVFEIEDSKTINCFNYGKHEQKCRKSQKVATKDFVTYKNSYVDYFKHAIFYWWYWFGLATVFLAGVFWITLFCLGYMIIAFIYLWMGHDIMIRNKKDLLSSLNVVIYYNFFVIFSKCALQLVGCVYINMLFNQGLCMLIPLFGIQCINPLSLGIAFSESHSPGDPQCIPVASGLHWDVICFFFLIMQRKIYLMKEFSHVIIDILVQDKFASRGAYIINRKMISVIQNQRKREEYELKKIEKKILQIMVRQVEHGKPELKEHYLVIRSGDYYLFEGDPSDDDFETDAESQCSSIGENVQVDFRRGPNKEFVEMNTLSENIRALSRRVSVTLPGNQFIPEGPMNSLEVLEENSVDTLENESFRMGTETTNDDEDRYGLPMDNPINPIQLISNALRQGPRVAVRKYRKTLSESKENLAFARQSNQPSRRSSMSRNEDPNFLPSNLSSRPISQTSVKEEDKLKVPFLEDNLIQLEIDPNTSNGNDDGLPSNISTSGEDEKEDLDADRATCWNVFKACFQFPFYLIMSSTDNLNRWLSIVTLEHRMIWRKLKIEKKMEKCEMMSGNFKEIDTKSSRVSEYIKDGINPFETSLNKNDITDEKILEHNKFFTLLILLASTATAYSEFICYFLLILNHINSCNLLSSMYPMMIFLWGMLSTPRPTKTFWTFLITYTEIVIIIKYVFQFNFIAFNVLPSGTIKIDKIWISLIGIEKSNNYAIFDVIQLFFIFIHRGNLRANGLWRDSKELRDDLKKFEKRKSTVSGYSHPMSDRSWNPVIRIQQFYAKMTCPALNKRVDVYSAMFICELLAFCIIILFYDSFGPGTDSADNAIDFIKTNKIPVPFIAMVITQFLFIIIDRALFLRKQVKGKFAFQTFHVVLIHGWLFFTLPYITKRKFSSRIGPCLLYVVKCVYFGLSAYQIKSGYPLRILGNFLTGDYKYVNLILFKGYMVVPFLYELRNVMDWMWTDSSVALYHWMEVEDIFCKIFVLKCWRYAELKWPTKRGINRRFWAKYTIGGLLLGILFICLWGPLAVGSFIGSTFVKNPPIECTFSINVGGYSPLFVFSARENYLRHLEREKFEKMQTCYQNDMSSTNYLKSFEDSDVTEIIIDGESDDGWLITPPGLEKLSLKLSQNDSLKVNSQLVCERGITDSKTTGKIVRYTYSRILDAEEKRKFRETMKIKNLPTSSVYLAKLFPRFLTAYKRKLLPASPLVKDFNKTFVELTLWMKSENHANWWEISETIRGKTYCSNSSFQTHNRSNVTLYIFNERVADYFFGNIFSNYGIIGIYAAYFFVVNRVLRTFYSNISYITQYEELPNVDRILKLLNDIYLVRESKMFLLEEQLIAQLIFLYRSSETMIKWTGHNQSVIEKHTAYSSNSELQDDSLK